MSLKVVNLSKRYKDKWVLRDISFEVAPGEIFGIAGASGTGKTTLIEVISGTLEANGGMISVDGREPSDEARSSWLYTQGGTSSSILERLFGSPTRRSDAPSNDISKWMESADSVLLLDEAFCSLDSTERDRQYALLVTAARERSLSVVFAAADFKQIMTICDRAAILAGTELKQTGTPQELYEDPTSRAVASATGRCNIFEARRLSSSKSDTPEFHTIDGNHRLFARNVERGALGAINKNVWLGIRPEHISISFGASFPEDNLLRATITGVRFLGAVTLIDLDSDGLPLQALVLRLVGLNVGDECVVGLPPDKVHIFRD